MRKFKYMLMCGMLLGCSIMSYPAMAANAQDIVSNSENIICDTKDDLQLKSVNPLDYEENTRERFVASMASDYNISYEMADKMEREQSKSIARVADEVLKYRTIDKKAGQVTNRNGYTIYPHISTEVQYVDNRATGNVVSLEYIGGPVFYVPDLAINESFATGAFNINKTGAKTGRVSITAGFSYTIPSNTITVGGDIMSISTTVGGYKITTKPKTFSITIAEANLK